MIKLFIFTLFTTALIAQNPHAYAALGDTIYDNADNIEKLKYIRSFEMLTPKIEKYIKEVEVSREYGFALDAHKKEYDKKEYLQQLRDLSKTNDFFIRSVRSAYKSALESNDDKLLFEILNTELIDIDDNFKEINAYYKLHTDAVQPKVYVQAFQRKRLEQQSIKAPKKKKVLSQKDIELLNIKRIRAKDKAKREALQKDLERESRRKKLQILQEQQKALSQK